MPGKLLLLCLISFMGFRLLHHRRSSSYNPNLEGVLGEVQASKERQRQFLFNNTYAFSRVTPDILLALEKWYGREVSREVKENRQAR